MRVDTATSTGTVRSDIARLTPLPSAKFPAVMFMGVLAGGEQAVVALGSGVQHAGPGLCRPAHDACSAILLKADDTERLLVPLANGSQQLLFLHVSAIHSTVTHSKSVALAAYHRHSVAGLCELALANPLAYNLSKGTVSTVTGTECDGQAADERVPFVVAGS